MKPGRKKINYYKEEVLLKKKNYYASLPEKIKRHYVGQEYLQLGEGSQSYLSKVFGCSRHTIRKGASEIKAAIEPIDYTRQRKIGGGRKKRIVTT